MRVTIAKVSEKLFDGEARELIVPGADGVLTILSNHMPLVTTLKKGEARVKVFAELDTVSFVIDGGVLEVSNNHAIVLL